VGLRAGYLFRRDPAIADHAAGGCEWMARSKHLPCANLSAMEKLVVIVDEGHDAGEDTHVIMIRAIHSGAPTFYMMTSLGTSKMK
jgi:hypothetical protein